VTTAANEAKTADEGNEATAPANEATSNRQLTPEAHAPTPPVDADDAPAGPATAPSAYADERDFSLDLAGRAGIVLMDHYERLERIDYKSARDVVTEADHLSEALILDAIRARYPGDAILAEETGEHRAIAGEAPTSGRGRVWIVDPLDGTVNYANGLPIFCVSIGLVVDGVPAVGVILDPTRAESFAATVDGPATLNGEPIHASAKEKVSDYVISMALNGRTASSRARNVRKAIRISRSMGSAALALAYVANGRFDAFIQQGGLSAWDVAAAGLIAERGGAMVTSMSGGQWFDLGHSSKSIGILAAPPAHHGALLALAK
jgi:myo-inositol-1(or 4)-monophosphatase